jgi:ABC-type transport system involved in multi-copper enzyme maturation permease subunit
MKILALIVNTLRELSTKATLYVIAGISTLIILVMLAGISSQTAADGKMVTLFGLPISPPVSAENLEALVCQMQTGFAKGLFAGVILFGVFATAGIIPDMLEKGTIDLYLSKPLARWELLLGKYLGAVAAMLLNIVYFLGAMWLIFGVKVGVWNVQLLLSSLTLTFVFACLFSIVALLGIVFRNAAIPIIGAFLYLLIVGTLLEGREHSLYLMSTNTFYRGFIEGLYYLFPQLSAMQNNIAGQILHTSMDWRPFVQSFLSSALIFGSAVAIFIKRDF